MELEKYILNTTKYGIDSVGVSPTEVQTALFVNNDLLVDLDEVKKVISKLVRDGLIQSTGRTSFGTSIIDPEATYVRTFAGEIALKYRVSLSNLALQKLEVTIQLIGVPITPKAYALAYLKKEKRVPPSVTAEFDCLVNSGLAVSTETGNISLTTLGKNVRKMLMDQKQ